MTIAWKKAVLPVVVIVTFVAAAVHAHEWMAPEEAGERVNPVEPSDSSVQRGLTVYMENCAACHGENLEGMSAETLVLNKEAPNLKESSRSHKDGDLFWKIQNGRGDMPAFKDELSNEQIWDIVNYIRDQSKG